MKRAVVFVGGDAENPDELLIGRLIDVLDPEVVFVDGDGANPAFTIAYRRGIKSSTCRIGKALETEPGALVVVLPGYLTGDRAVTSKIKSARWSGNLVWEPKTLPPRPPAKPTLGTGMNDLARFKHLLATNPWRSVEEMQAIVDKNQNRPPDGGADGSFLPHQWEAARDIARSLATLNRAMHRIDEPPPPPPRAPDVPPAITGPASSRPPYGGAAPSDSDGFIDDDLPF